MDPAAERKAIRAVDWLGVEKSHVPGGDPDLSLILWALGQYLPLSVSWVQSPRSVSHRDRQEHGMTRGRGGEGGWRRVTGG